MGTFTGTRTPHALRKAKEFFAGHSLDDEFEKQRAKTKQYLEASGPAPSLSFLANICEATSHANCKTVSDLETIDWERWRLATELRLLQWRLDAVTHLVKRRWSWVEVSNALHLGISLNLSGREKLALPIFESLATGLPPVLDQMTSRKDRSRDWGAIAYVFQDVMDLKALPKPLQVAPPETLEQAIAARATYSDRRDPYGSLLSHAGANLIPVELVFFVRKRENSDPELRYFDEKIRTSSYPDHPVFQEMDLELSIAGL